MKKIALLFLLSLTGIILKAQVKGIVIDSATKMTINRATVGLVLNEKTSDTTYTFTNEKGEFDFDIVLTSDFTIVVTNIGYAPTTRRILIKQQSKTISLGIIMLKQISNTLNAITTVTSLPIVIKEDTVEYRASAFRTKEGAVVEDLLKKLPGIKVDKNGSILAQGQEIVQVKVNGKDFFSGDVKLATKKLPANIVDKIQIVEDYGDQAKISGIKEGKPDKIINIELKKDKNKGVFGSADFGSGTLNKYQFNFNSNYFKDKTQVSLFARSDNTNTSSFGYMCSQDTR